MIKKKLFLASSSELADDRKEFEIFINRRNKEWVDRGVFLELVIWEDFLDAVSRTRLQDDYNQAIRECDIFVMLFFTKVGRYTEEEFETAFGQFQATNKPFIFTYFKDAQISTGSVDEDDLISLLTFKKKLSSLGHFYTRYENVDALKLHFGQQLDKLVANGFIELRSDTINGPASGGSAHDATLAGNGAIAQGSGATSIGAGGVSIGGNNDGDINSGTQTIIDKKIDTGGGAYVGGNVHAGGDFVGRDQTKIAHGVSPGDLELLFRPLWETIEQQAPPAKHADATQQVEQLKAEVAKDDQADDGRIARIIEGLVEMVPGAIGSIVGLFATPILAGVAGPVTKYVLDKLKGN